MAYVLSLSGFFKNGRQAACVLQMQMGKPMMILNGHSKFKNIDFSCKLTSGLFGVIKRTKQSSRDENYTFSYIRG